MFRLRSFLVIFLMAGLLVMPLRAEEELPVEVDIDLLSESMNLEQAKQEIEQDLEEEGLETGMKNRRGKKALRVLESLVEKGVPVKKAYESVSEAVKKGEDVEDVDSEKNVKALKKEAAKETVEEEAEEKGLKAEDVSVAVEVLDGLIEKGIPVEKARDAVKEAISEDRDPKEIKEMLAQENVERIKEQPDRKGIDKETIGEKIRQKNRERLNKNIQEKIEDIQKQRGEDIEDNIR